MQKIHQITAGVLCGLMLLAVAPAANAATAKEVEIARLYAIVLELQAKLATLQGETADVQVVTVGVEAEDNVVDFSGEIDFNGERSARVWFEYGTSYSLNYSTPAVTLQRSSSDSKSFTISGFDFEDNTLYYYRAVAEDRSNDIAEGTVRTFRITDSDWDDRDDDDEEDDDRDDDYPQVTTDEADDVTEDTAELTGEVDMHDFENGLVFMAYGEDEEMVEDVEDESSYDDIDTDGDDLRKVRLDTSFDDEDDFSVTVTGLTDDTEHYFRLCVEFEDEDDDETLVCGDVESFETDRD